MLHQPITDNDIRHTKHVVDAKQIADAEGFNKLLIICHKKGYTPA